MRHMIRRPRCKPPACQPHSSHNHVGQFKKPSLLLITLEKVLLSPANITFFLFKPAGLSCFHSSYSFYSPSLNPLGSFLAHIHRPLPPVLFYSSSWLLERVKCIGRRYMSGPVTTGDDTLSILCLWYNFGCYLQNFSRPTHSAQEFQDTMMKQGPFVWAQVWTKTFF